MRMFSARLRGRAALPAAAVATVALLAAGCSGGGGGSTPGAGGNGNLFPGLTVQKMDAFAACMRNHGVPNFYVSGGNGNASPSGNTPVLTIGGFQVTGVNPQTPQFQSGMKSCRHLLGIKPPSQAEQHQQFEQALKASACMRSHGYPNYPDPQMAPNGQGIEFPGPPSGVDTSSPQYQKAAKTCGVGP